VVSVATAVSAGSTPLVSPLPPIAAGTSADGGVLERTAHMGRKATRPLFNASEPTADTAVSVCGARPTVLEPTARMRAKGHGAAVAATVPTAQRTVSESSARATARASVATAVVQAKAAAATTWTPTPTTAATRTGSRRLRLTPRGAQLNSEWGSCESGCVATTHYYASLAHFCTTPTQHTSR
jgi:hypothetical protein